MVGKSAPVTVSANYSIARTVLHGVLGGICGGIAFGLMMLNFAPQNLVNIGRMIGFESTAGGWAYHLFISITIGSIFGLVLGRICTNYKVGLLWGLCYGLTWWVLGALILSPLMQGAMQRVLTLSPTSWVGFSGHLMYGALTGLITVWLNRRSW